MTISGTGWHRDKSQTRRTLRVAVQATATVLVIAMAPVLGQAQTISDALVHAYVSNPDLNQQRAAGRASDEGVARAQSGYRPQAAATASYGYNYTDGVLTGVVQKGKSFPMSGGVTVTQNVFNGFQTLNGVRAAESSVFQMRQLIRNTEQTVLLNATTAYMNVLRDTAILELDTNNIVVIEEQLRVSRRRLSVGEVTKTDVAQAESSLATARSNYFTARATLQNSVANFRQVTGIEPARLHPARPVDSLLPPNLGAATKTALTEHPAIQAALHSADAAAAQVKIYEGQLYPTVNFAGNVQQNNQYSGLPQNRLFNASLLAQLSVPVYTGGAADAQVRQAKELYSQALFQSDVQRETVRAGIVSAWGLYETARAVILSSAAAVKAAEVALDGVRTEAKVGQRTTLDILMAQQTLLNARVNLVSAQRDRVVASYTVLAASGRLSAATLALNTVVYNPTIHYAQVKDKWFGLRTASGQ